MKKISIITGVLLSCTMLLSAPIQAAVSINKQVPVVSQQKSINLNTADSHALLHAVKGLGQKRAGAIVEYRKAHGGFKSIDELAHVHGFGARFVQANLKQLKAVFVL